MVWVPCKYLLLIYYNYGSNCYQNNHLHIITIIINILTLAIHYLHPWSCHTNVFKKKK